ncbi:hypothetical protein GOBAR_AA30625 [Gossypium barbadense]|uniref:Proteasome alpha-type subunits domain-containing protein n=1 Tax=Gossypium barbadense TaxID=3634 RepID=A0A2P5WG22_GOSBA|nr:hypothetical protein GOBAR_AA30625 [Gossypium barbadense]
MSSIGTGVFQIEYASKAVDNSGTVIGIKCKDGIVMAVAGLAADGRQIVARAKSEATSYQSVYGEPIPVKELAERVASNVHLCTLYWWLRPFGCGVILGGYDRDGPQLYMVEPSGISYVSSFLANGASFFFIFLVASSIDGEIKALFFLDKTRRDSEDRRRSDLRFLDLERGEISDILSTIPPDVYNGFSVVTCGNHAYAIGGKMIYRSTDHVFRFDFKHAERGWRKATSMLYCRGFPEALAVEGKIYVFEGSGVCFGEVYDISGDSWVPLITPSIAEYSCSPRFFPISDFVGIAGNVLYVFYEFCDETFWKAYDVQDKKWLPLKWLTEFSCTSGCSSDSFGHGGIYAAGDDLSQNALVYRGEYNDEAY